MQALSKLSGTGYVNCSKDEPCSGPLQGQILREVKHKRLAGQQPTCNAKQQKLHRKAWANFMAHIALAS